MRIAIQMDPITSINPLSDSTILLAFEACWLEYEVYYYTPADLTYESGGRLTARAQPLTILSLEGEWRYTLGDALQLDLAQMDVILLRQDPPFDMAYVTTTFMLERLEGKSGRKPLVVNNPREVRNHPEKWFPLQFPDLVPPTLISRDLKQLEAFRKEQGEIVLKPLYGYGGKSVFHIGRDDMNFYSFLEMYFEYSREPIIAQAFLSDVRTSEKRIIIVDDYVAPVMNRVPQAGEIRSNTRIGGTPQKIELTLKQQAVVARLVPEFQKRGLLLVGLDMIGDYITEINVTSPTGLRWVNKAYGVRLEKTFWDKVTALLSRG